MDVLLSFLFSIIKLVQNTSTVYLSVSYLCDLPALNEKMHLSFCNISLMELSCLFMYTMFFCSSPCNLYEQKRRPMDVPFVYDLYTHYNDSKNIKTCSFLTILYIYFDSDGKLSSYMMSAARLLR